MTVKDIDGIAARWPGPGGTVFQPGSADWAGLLGIHVNWIGDTIPTGDPGRARRGRGDRGRPLRHGADHRRPGGRDVGREGQGGVLHPAGERVRRAVGIVHRRPSSRSWRSATCIVSRAREGRWPRRRRAIRNIGHANPDAVMYGRGPYTAEDVLAAPKVVEPFTRLELCLANEGAAALVVTSIERARDCRQAAGRGARRRCRVDAPAVRRSSSLRGGLVDRRRRGIDAGIRDGRHQCRPTST